MNIAHSVFIFFISFSNFKYLQEIRYFNNESKINPKILEWWIFKSWIFVCNKVTNF